MKFSIAQFSISYDVNIIFNKTRQNHGKIKIDRIRPLTFIFSQYEIYPRRSKKIS